MTGRWLVLFLLLPIGFSFCKAGKSEPKVLKPPATTYIIFLDLSLSLNEVQERSMSQSLVRLCAGIPARSRITVLPLGGYVARAGVLLERTFPDDEFATDQGDLETLRSTLPATIETAVRAYKAAINDPLFAQHTCVSDAIRHSAQLARDAPSGGSIEIVLFSDMLEDCPQSLLRVPLDLEKQDIRGELAKAQAIPATDEFLDLRRANITCIVPISGPTPTKTRQPQLDTLREFWTAVLSHCRHNESEFRLGTSVPSRLQQPQPIATTVTGGTAGTSVK